MSIFRRVRLGSWALLVLCFVLPFAKGCNDTFIYPFRSAFGNFGSFLTWGLPFLYPLLFAGIAWVALRLGRTAYRDQLFHALFLGSFGALTWLVVRWHVALLEGPLDWPDPELVLFLGMVMVWASMGVRADKLVPDEIPRRLAVQWSTASFMVVTLLFLLADPLYGAWLAFFASAVVMVTYAAEYLRRRLGIAAPEASSSNG